MKKIERIVAKNSMKNILQGKKFLETDLFFIFVFREILEIRCNDIHWLNEIYIPRDWFSSLCPSDGYIGS